MVIASSATCAPPCATGSSIPTPRLVYNGCATDPEAKDPRDVRLRGRLWHALLRGGKGLTGVDGEDYSAPLCQCESMHTSHSGRWQEEASQLVPLPETHAPAGRSSGIGAGRWCRNMRHPHLRAAMSAGRRGRCSAGNTARLWPCAAGRTGRRAGALASCTAREGSGQTQPP